MGNFIYAPVSFQDAVLIMPNALILHGTNKNSQAYWLPWLKQELEQQGYNVWSPDLPHAEQPNMGDYCSFLLSKSVQPNGWRFDQDTILIGHSSGAVAILGLLQSVSADEHVRTSYLLGSFRDNLGRDDLKDLFSIPFDFPLIKSKCEEFVFLHSDNDPFCPIEGAQYLCDQVGGEFIIMPGQQHFTIRNGGPQYTQFPALLKIILEREALLGKN